MAEIYSAFVTLLPPQWSGNTRLSRHATEQHFPVFSQTTHFSKCIFLKVTKQPISKVAVFFQTGWWEHCVQSQADVVIGSRNSHYLIFVVELFRYLGTSDPCWSDLSTKTPNGPVFPAVYLEHVLVIVVWSMFEGSSALYEAWGTLSLSFVWFWIKMSVLAQVSVKPWFVDHVVSCTIQNLMLKP